LELEDADLALVGDALDLREERPGTLAPRELVVFEELALGEAPVELLVADEVVVDTFDLVRAACARRRRDGELQLGEEVEQALDQRSFAGARLTGDDDDGQLVTG